MGCQKWAARETIRTARNKGLGLDMGCQKWTARKGAHANQVMLAINNHNLSYTCQIWKDTEKISMAVVQR